MIRRLVPSQVRDAIRLWKAVKAGREFAHCPSWHREVPEGDQEDNELRAFFRNRREGAGIWKWQHYFEAYHRHLSKFRGRPVRILEIGIYSGGSLDMWRSYFGASAEIFGVDIEPECLRYSRDGVTVFIGDQADRSFWARVRAEVPSFDIVVDDGGHQARQQIVSIEELLPYMNTGGVYICEDVHGSGNEFAHYVSGLASELNAMDGCEETHDDPERRLIVRSNQVQSLVHSVSIYPFLIAIELLDCKMPELIAPKHGTRWAPFLD